MFQPCVLARRVLGLAMLLLTLTFTSQMVVAQTTTGSIYGTVSDGTGAVVPNVNVIATNVQTGATKTAVTTGSGDYTFLVLDPGDYTVAAQVSGFQSQTQSGIRLAA